MRLLMVLRLALEDARARSMAAGRPRFGAQGLPDASMPATF